MTRHKGNIDIDGLDLHRPYVDEVYLQVPMWSTEWYENHRGNRLLVRLRRPYRHMLNGITPSKTSGGV